MITRLSFSLVVALSFTSVPLAAQSLDGLYDGWDCTQTSDQRLQISGATISFYESQCTITATYPIAGMTDTYVYDVQCAGEGQEWVNRFVITPNYDGGVILINDGLGQSYQRCGG